MGREPPQALPALVINLDRSTERWERLAATVEDSGVELIRIAAVDGSQVAPADRADVDVAAFRRNHGRELLDGEYGCYRSHLAALHRVVDEGYPHAVIAEDDIGFQPGLADRVRALFAAAPSADVIKLVNHRVSGFRRHGQSALGDEFGRCLHGPQGSAACYAVSQEGARRLLRALATMWLPYDIAFERGWSTGASSFTTREALVTFEGHLNPTTIATRQQYQAAKLPRLMQVGTLVFRASDYLARMAYAYRKG